MSAVDPRQRLIEHLATSAVAVAGLEREHALMVSASESSNADDEHDPEGSTIAFERQQLSALLELARRTRVEVEQALDRLDQGAYGRCERCDAPIPAERLEARPNARTCIACAA